MGEKVYDIVSDDLGTVCFSLEKILAAAQSARSYLDEAFCEPSEQTNAVLCMFGIIEDLANTASKQLITATNKICVLCNEAKQEVQINEQKSC